MNTRRATTTVAVLLVLVSLTMAGARGCQRTGAGGPQPQSLPTIKMKVGNRVFNVEVANTDPSREMGLMYRDSMPADHGMIFVFPDEEKLNFWMKNTRIPLDIAYLDAVGKVVSVKSMKPYDLSGVPSDFPAKFAIELNQGAAAEAGLHTGDVVEIPADIANSAR